MFNFLAFGYFRPKKLPTRIQDQLEIGQNYTLGVYGDHLYQIWKLYQIYG
jgi:hypothetical protein